MVGIWVLVQLISLALAAEFGSFGETDEELARQFEQKNDQSLLWGPYRSNVYLGVRPRVPESLVTGFVWFRADSYAGMQNIRHQCDSRDGMDTFGWMQYDPRLGGLEVIEDTKNELSLKARFVKSDNGQNWALKITGTPKKRNALTSLVFYAGMEGEEENLLMMKSPKTSPELVKGHDVSLLGFSEPLGGLFYLNVTEGRKSSHPSLWSLKDKALDPAKTHHLSMHVPDGNVWKAKDIMMVLLQENFEPYKEDMSQLRNIPPAEMLQLKSPNGWKDGNMHLVQKTFKGKFELTVTFNAIESPEIVTDKDFDAQYGKSLKTLKDKFAQKIQLERPFNNGNYTRFARHFLSQLIGGIGYFYGEQLVDRDADIDNLGAPLQGKPEGPYSLFSCVPSRTFFPRGFYWDEGFQLMPILKYDSDLALDIIKSWFSLIDKDGWIAREQILGEESRSRVPDQFVVQNPNIANPPTMMMVFNELLHTETPESAELGDTQLANRQLLHSYARDIYPKLKLHYEWFRRTQQGEADTAGKCRNPREVYQWKGRDEEHCLPSGLDDYPRCSIEAEELNVDLMSWMGVMTQSMAGIAKLLGEQKDLQTYTSRLSDIKANLDDIHWSDANNSYCDVAVDEDDEHVFECHIGYITLMPFAHKLIEPDSPHLIHVLHDIRDPHQLWTQYGIRSLSKQDASFHQGEDYWRGHIWINMNYLILDALRYYGQHEKTRPEAKELAAKIYTELRSNVVQNVYREYKETGYAWEQYNELTGKGQRTQNFLGWTSLVVLMMMMPETL